MAAAPRLAATEATRRWAALLQQIFEVDPLTCPICHGAMRVVAFITQASVIDQILSHLHTRAAHAAHAGARSPPSTRAPREPEHVTRPTPVRRRPDRPMRTAPRRPATTRGRSACAAIPPRRHRGPRRPRVIDRTQSRRVREGHRHGGGRAVARAPVLARQGTGDNTQRTAIETLPAVAQHRVDPLCVRLAIQCQRIECRTQCTP